MLYTVIRGPVRAAERALAPDFSRGLMLLGIALANAAGVALGGPGTAPQPTGLDPALNLAMNVLVHGRVYPVFAILFGYGLVQLARRQEAAGATPRAVRSLLLRRHAWLVVFGLCHATLLYYGDFLGAYGIIGIVATYALLDRGERVQRVVLWLWAATVVEVVAFAAMAAWRIASGTGIAAGPAGTTVASLVADGYAASMRARLAEWPAHTLTVLPAIVIVWLGMWAARRRLLEEPDRHAVLLRRVALGGLAIAYLGGLPLGLASAGLLTVDASSSRMVVLLHQVSGMFGGPGYVAATAFVASAFRRNSLAHAVAALGQRSLSGYLFQSIVWVVALAPYGLDLSRKGASPLSTGLIVAFLTWIVSVAVAGVLQRRGVRGPAESLLRRLTYLGAAAR